MADNDVFNSDTPTETTSFLAQLVGEGKKYKDEEALAKSRLDADNYIEQLKRENEGLRTDLGARVSVEETIAKFQRNTQPAPASEVQTSPAVAPALDEKSLIERIRQVNLEQSREQTLASNVEAAAKRLIEVYGDQTKANEVVKNKAAELGVSVKFLQDTASQSPKAFFELVGLDNQAQSSPPPTRSDVNMEAFRSTSPAGAKPGTYAYYEALRVADPKAYWQPATQNRLMKDAFDKGDAFYG